ncbi:MAG: hypothetical protein B7Y99_06765 [Caulobacterales bacterium 32-69-10]|nr:MAG: hypothetical protein B7Y99_06765 [Caulobacterales bacterium 32-69-10]
MSVVGLTSGRLPRPDFEQIALVLQGGGALGSYQAGVFEALDECGIALDWIAGVSIGAVNAALIAGNAPERRLEALRGFWREVSADPWGVDWLRVLAPGLVQMEPFRVGLNHLSAATASTFGVRSMFAPHPIPPWLSPPGSRNAVSLYDSDPLKAALTRFVDFDRINVGPMRFSVGAVNIRTGNFDYFDTANTRIRLEHVLASAALPPMFPPVEVDGELYWDGGLVSNTPLQWVAEGEPKLDTLVFQVDLWNTRGQAPGDLTDVVTRQKEIQYASRTRASTDAFRRIQRLKNAVSEALADLPPEVCALPQVRKLAAEVDRKVFRIVHLIYHARPHQGATKDFEFSRLNVEEHWRSGYEDAANTLYRPEALARPDLDVTEGVATFDIAVDSPGGGC